MRDFLVIAILACVVALLIKRNSSGYNPANFNLSSSASRPPNPWSMFEYSPLSHESLIEIAKIISNQLNGTTFYENVNKVITAINEPIANKFELYDNDEDLKIMFQFADQRGEENLYRNDKLVLRFMSYFGYRMKDLCGSQINTDCPAGSDGVLSWANSVMSETKRSTIDDLKSMFYIAGEILSYSITDDMVNNTINPILPSRLVKFNGADDYITRSSNKDPSAIWLTKYYMIGPLFIYWKAITKWNLDNSIEFELLTYSQIMDSHF